MLHLQKDKNLPTQVMSSIKRLLKLGVVNSQVQLGEVMKIF